MMRECEKITLEVDGETTTEKAAANEFAKGYENESTLIYQHYGKGKYELN